MHNAQNFKEETELTASKNNFVITGLVLATFPLHFNEKKEEVENDIRNTMNLKCRETKHAFETDAGTAELKGRDDVMHLEKAAKLIWSIFIMGQE